jgi:hypothetical protein
LRSWSGIYPRLKWDGISRSYHIADLNNGSGLL